MSRTTSIAAAITGVSLVAAAVLGGSAAADTAPANDNFDAAIALTGESWSASIDNTGATTEGGEATGSGATSTRGSSVWLSWTPQTAQSVTLLTDKGFGVGVFTGDSVANATEVAFGATQVALDAVAGEKYAIQVSSLGDAPAGVATVTLTSTEAAPPRAKVAPKAKQPPTLSIAPEHDDFANAEAISGTTPYTYLSLVDATTEAGETTKVSGGVRFYNTAWVKWKAPVSGAITVDTKDSPSSADTALAIYTGTSYKNDKRLAVNDDSNGDFRARLASVTVKKGVTYRIQAGLSGYSSGPSTTPGVIMLSIRGSWEKPANDDKSSATKTTGTSWTVTGTTAGATNEVFEDVSNSQNTDYPLRNSIWYKWTATTVGYMALSTQGSAVDTALRAYREDVSGGLIPIAFNDDVQNSTHAELSFVSVAPGYTYYFVVSNPVLTSLGELGNPGATKLAATVTYTSPVISSISPTSGKLAGGGKITITGSRLTDVKNVRFGDVYATNVTVVSPTKVTATIPAGVKKGKVAVIAATIWNVGNPVHAKTYYTYK